MSASSSIEWTDATWNPVVGCTKVSPGCKHCYAETLTERFRGVPGHPFERGFDLRLVPNKLQEPTKWRKPKKIFTCSISDLFHEGIPFDYIKAVFEVMVAADWHTYQVLTKRSDRLNQIAERLPWPEHVWMGVSVESGDYVKRISDLLATPARVRFLSLEPLLGPLPHLQLDGIDWVIVGGESGPKARPMDPAWAREIREQCTSAGVAFFLKQLGGARKKRGGDEAVLDGRLWHQFPPRLSEVYAVS